MKEFKIDSYLYLPLGTTESEATKILESRFDSSSINEIETRETEIAVDFDIIIESESNETAKEHFLNALQGFDVDNYAVKEA